MAGFNDKAGADLLNLPPWADIQCCPHPYISEPMLLVVAINSECAVRCGNRAGTANSQARTDRSHSANTDHPAGRSASGDRCT